MTMYLEHFGLNEAPFKITPHTEFFFAGANRGETLEALLYAITSGEGIVKVTGEVGAGKTMLCRVLMERLPPTIETIYMAVPSLSRDEMLASIATDLGIETAGFNTTKLIRALQECLIDIHAEGRSVVALIDEAHAMPLETLEEIRLLSNLETSHHKLMQIVLFGQPELDEHLSLTNMRQLRERITHSFNLLPLPARDIKDYIDHRLRAAGYKGPDLFGADSLKLIAEASEGLTRRINIFADKTLLAAFAAGTHTVTSDHVRAAISDTQIVVRPTGPRRATLLLSVCAATLIGLVLGFFAGRATVGEGLLVATATPAAMPVQKSVAAKLAGSVPAPTPSGSADAPIPSSAAQPPVTGDKVLAATTPASAVAAVSAVSGRSPADDAKPATTEKIIVKAPEVALAPAMSRMTGLDWLDKRMRADVSRLEKLPGGRYSIQLLTADPGEKGAIESYLRIASRELNADRIMVYPSGTPENPRVSVLYGNYLERADASTELAQLPTKVSQFRPYVRSFQTIRDDLRPLK